MGRRRELSEERGETDAGAGGGLADYRRKRSADRTPEPFGARAPRPGIFVVQQHAARRLHFDLRLEWRGVLLSWAVPKGPSLDPAQKRLAVQVEDHPVDYADFEGRIPEGSYGAGQVIVWDRGRWVPVEDPDAGLAAGKLLFDLEGEKLRGRFTLVRTGGRRRPESREWLLIKKPDAFARPEAEAADDASVLSGLTLDERRAAPQREQRLLRAMQRAGAERRRVDPAQVRPMLAQRLDAPFSDPAWLFELKIDGYRMIGAVSDGVGVLRTRNGQPASERFPEVTSALAALPWSHLVVDGEIAATDAEGRPSFQRLQQRARLGRAPEVARAALTHPVTYFVFDLLGFGDLDLRGLPLERRRAFLDALLPRRGALRVLESFPGRGEALHRVVSEHGLEGIVAKRADAPYRAGRSPAWRKLRNLASDDFAIVGFTEPERGRRGFGALHLAWFAEGGFVYAGRVGTGFDEAGLGALRTALDPLRRDTPPCSGPVPRTGRDRWVEPRLVCEVRYSEVTRDGLLRQPVFLRLRDDKTPEECERPERGREAPPPPAGLDAGPADAGGAPATLPDGAAREVPLTHLDKVFWPGEGLTKGDLVDYYRAISPWLLPYLRDRPLVMTRYPDGIEGKSFYQKDAPDWAPGWLRREVVWSEHAGREVHYFVCDDLASLLYVVNMGSIPLHVWCSRAASLAHPDWCILDLDPKGAPFAHVLRVAREIHELCESLALPTFPKTSGSSGLHVLIPLGATLRYEQSRTLGELLARLVVERLPEIATVTRRVSAREGKVYVDYLQNRHGQLLVAPFSVRPLPGAPVSMPLRWSEVHGRLTPQRFTLANALRRMRRLREDPGIGVLGPAPDLPGALARLAEHRVG